MSESSGILSPTLRDELKSLIREVLQEAANGNGHLQPLLGAEEVAKILGIDVRVVYRQARTKKIPSIKVGKYWKFSPVELQKWLERKNTS